MPADLERLARQFTNFAETGTSGDSPLYEHLSQRIAADADLLALAGEKLPDQPPPNILFAAVHDLLIGGADHPLRNFYPNLTAQPDTGDPFPAFRDFCLSRRADLLPLIRTRRTQTNEVNRCALLLPAFTVVANRLGGGRAALIELGPSAGLNLNWQHYGYNYGENRVYRGTAPLEVGAPLRGSRLPPLPRVIPPFEIVSNRGVEILPINLSDPENVRWLKALVWPEHTARFELLSRAIEFARQHPPEVLAGDALARLPRLLAETPAGVVPIVYHTFVTYQFPEEKRLALFEQLAEAGSARTLYRVSIEWLSEAGTMIELDAFEGGRHSHTLLARCHPHGRWLEWDGAPGGE